MFLSVAVISGTDMGALTLCCSKFSMRTSSAVYRPELAAAAGTLLPPQKPAAAFIVYSTISFAPKEPSPFAVAERQAAL